MRCERPIRHLSRSGARFPRKSLAAPLEISVSTKKKNQCARDAHRSVSEPTFQDRPRACAQRCLGMSGFDREFNRPRRLVLANVSRGRMLALGRTLAQGTLQYGTLFVVFGVVFFG